MLIKKSLFYSNHVINKIIKRCLHQNHYQILKLKRNCTTKDIKKAFIDLSKKSHPDKNHGSKDNHNEYVRILEAYNVLSKPSTRAEYDLGLRFDDSSTNRQYQHVYPMNSDSFAAREQFFYKAYENKSYYARHDAANEPYYGIRGLNKVDNVKIALICIAFAFIGAMVQGILIRSSFVFNSQKLDRISTENSKFLTAIQSEAEEKGNEAQIQKLMSNYKDYHSRERFV